MHPSRAWSASIVFFFPSFSRSRDLAVHGRNRRRRSYMAVISVMMYSLRRRLARPLLQLSQATTIFLYFSPSRHSLNLKICLSMRPLVHGHIQAPAVFSDIYSCVFFFCYLSTQSMAVGILSLLSGLMAIDKLRSPHLWTSCPALRALDETRSKGTTLIMICTGSNCEPPRRWRGGSAMDGADHEGTMEPTTGNNGGRRS